MAQQRVTCNACGNQEAAGVRFCGRCGAPMDGSGAPLGRTPRPNNQMAGGARPPSGGFTSNPTAIAAVLGVVAVVIIVAALLLSGGGDNKKDDPNARRPGGSGGAGGDFPTLTAPNVIPTPTPQVVPTLAPIPTPEPTATPVPQPTATPVPPQPEPQPQPQPQPQPHPEPQPQPTPVPQPQPQPALPARVTSPNVRLGVCAPGNTSQTCTAGAAGHGSQHRVGEAVFICYVSGNNTWIRIYDQAVPGSFLLDGVESGGTGDCANASLSPPLGVDTVIAEVYSVQNTAQGARPNALLGRASISFYINP